MKTNCVIYWIEIFSADSVINLLNNWGLRRIDEESFSAMMRISFKNNAGSLMWAQSVKEDH